MHVNPRLILVACIGNIFLGDDAFGVEVAKVLRTRQLPPDVVVVDFGIRGLDLTYALLDDWELIIFVDAIPRGGEPGTVYVVEPDLSDLKESTTHGGFVDAHDMNPMNVLQAAFSMGAQLKRIRLVGCEPSPMESEEQMGLSPAVEAAVNGAATVIESVVDEFLRETREKESNDVTR
jgi:hydrogenase maturation protease